MSKLILLIGPPAAGKSTFAGKFLELTADVVYLNADSIRKELYGNEDTQGDGSVVFGLLFSRLRQAVKDNKDILVDNTSVRKGHRKKILSMIHSDYEIFYKVFKTPLDVCLARNAKRDRKVPEAVIRNFYKVLQEQDLESETTNIEYLFGEVTE